LVEAIQRMGRQAFALVENAFDAVFGPRINPFYHLGALSFFFFWVVAASGIYLYIFFETSIEGAFFRYWVTKRPRRCCRGSRSATCSAA